MPVEAAKQIFVRALLGVPSTILSLGIVGAIHGWGYHPEQVVTGLIMDAPSLLATKTASWMLLFLLSVVIWGLFDFLVYRRASRNDGISLMLWIGLLGSFAVFAGCGAALYFRSAEKITKDEKVTGQTLSPAPAPVAGIRIHGGTGLRVEGNTVHNAGVGVEIHERTSNSSISYNEITAPLAKHYFTSQERDELIGFLRRLRQTFAEEQKPYVVLNKLLFVIPFNNESWSHPLPTVAEAPTVSAGLNEFLSDVRRHEQERIEIIKEGQNKMLATRIVPLIEDQNALANRMIAATSTMIAALNRYAEAGKDEFRRDFLGEKGKKLKETHAEYSRWKSSSITKIEAETVAIRSN